MILYILPSNDFWNILWSAISAIATVGTLFVAVLAYRSWKKQLIEGKKLSLCEETMISFYEMERIVKDIRAPMQPSISSEAIEKFIGKSGLSQDQCRQYEVSYKLSQYRNEINSFSKCYSKAKVYFGKDLLDLFSKMNLLINNIQDAPFWIYGKSGGEESDFIEEQKAFLYSYAPGYKKVSQELDDIIKAAEGILKKDFSKIY